MGIGHQPLTQVVLAIEPTPDLRPAHKEPLISCIPVQNRRFFTAQRQPIGIMSHGETRQIGDILAHCQLGVHIHSFDWAISGVLFTKLVGAGLESRGIFLRPPVTQQAIAVGLAALIVESVGDLMADYGANSAVVDRRVGMWIEKGRL